MITGVLLRSLGACWTDERIAAPAGGISSAAPAQAVCP